MLHDRDGCLVTHVVPRQPHDLHGYGPRRHGLWSAPQDVEDQPPKIGEPLRPVLRPHPRHATAAQDRQGGVQVEDVSSDRDRLALKVGQSCGQLGAFGL